MRIPSRSDDEGFTLVELLVAVTVVLIVMAALATFLISTTVANDRSRAGGVAAQLSVAALDRARAVGAAAAVSGRDSVSTSAQLNHALTVDYPAASPVVSRWRSNMRTAVDITAGSGNGLVATLPTKATVQIVNGTKYYLNYYVGDCWRPSTAAGECVNNPSGGVQFVRVVAVLSWLGQDCPQTGCVLPSATLLNDIGDPVFNFNQAPPPTPLLAAIPAQSSMVGAAVAGLTATATSGVPPFAFVLSGMPPGLALDDSGLHPGLISGTPTAGGTYSVKVTVTDAFLNSDTKTFAWTIYDALSFTVPDDQQSVAGQSVTLLPTYAPKGGTGTGYTWSAQGLPPGLSIAASTGRISGTLTAASGSATPYDVAITLTNSAGATTLHFLWRVDFAPLAGAAPAAQNTTVGASVNLALAAAVTGGSGQGIWTDPTASLPAGLTLTGATVTGRPTTTGASPISLTYTDSGTGEVTSVSFAWNVLAAPTIGPIANQTTPRSTSVGWTPPFTCANGPCNVSYQSLPSGLTWASGTGTVSGRTSTRTSTSTVKATITDASGITASATFTWKVT